MGSSESVPIASESRVSSASGSKVSSASESKVSSASGSRVSSASGSHASKYLNEYGLERYPPGGGKVVGIPKDRFDKVTSSLPEVIAWKAKRDEALKREKEEKQVKELINKIKKNL